MSSDQESYSTCWQRASIAIQHDCVRRPPLAVNCPTDSVFEHVFPTICTFDGHLDLIDSKGSSRLEMLTGYSNLKQATLGMRRD